MIYIYVDGESHYIRNDTVSKTVYGVGLPKLQRKGIDMYKLLVEERCHFFWDTQGSANIRHICPRMTYFTSFAGGDDDLHQMRLLIRSHGFDPYIVKERKINKTQRENDLTNLGIVEKPKGVDIELATRMLEDAVLRNFDEAHLYTSDSDFIPVIKAVRRMGKRVIVYGFKNGLQANSELEYVPDEFKDLQGLYDNKIYQVVS